MYRLARAPEAGQFGYCTTHARLVPRCFLIVWFLLYTLRPMYATAERALLRATRNANARGARRGAEARAAVVRQGRSRRARFEKGENEACGRRVSTEAVSCFLRAQGPPGVNAGTA